MEEKESFLKRGISMGELIGFAVTIISTGIIFYTSTQVRLNALELRVDMQDKQSKTIIEKLERIEDKQDGIKEKINDVELKLTNKMDRKIH
jgi:hypothetical protein